jgi:hypothetical protein
MGQSIGSVGNGHKQKGATDQSKNQPEVRPGQKMADQGQPKGSKRGGAAQKPDGGADHGARSRR